MEESLKWGSEGGALRSQVLVFLGLDSHDLEPCNLTIEKKSRQSAVQQPGHRQVGILKMTEIMEAFK